MSQIDELIERIRDRQFKEALDILEAQPKLATEQSDRSGQLHGATPLHWAAHRNAAEVCERLIKLNADVNKSASDWWRTPLAWGADAASEEAVRLLLDHGADVNQDAVVGTTALHAVAMGGSSRGQADVSAYRRTAEILIAAGADVNRQTDKGRTPLDEAVDNGNTAVAEVLQQHGAMRSEEVT